ncbi:hypothetical protein SH1V18_43800 [Vallitalea longa]|uniref:Uncharacterized protein n=1 Tax=Vallitalea longa TaxID=2936439 RepID=A0A9W5YD56_9FIRM|nr:hypothetical protein [Vallitalea longa]GKX31900.1 hypothetical protein SH1V18_43800 [Vallitalea longa]
MKKSYKTLLIILFYIVLIYFIKPIRLVNLNNINKIVITNEAESNQSSLTLDNNEINKFKKSMGNFTILPFTLNSIKVVYNLRMDLYHGRNKKYSFYFYSHDNIFESVSIPSGKLLYKMNSDVLRLLEEILLKHDFSLEGY